MISCLMRGGGCLPRPGGVDSQACCLRCESGFTLVEIIAVFILLGIMIALVVSHGSDFGAEAELGGAVEVVKNHLRFAQNKAMNADLAWGLNFSGPTYTLQDAAHNVVSLPGDGPPNGFTYSATINPVMFENRWGSPGNSTITVSVSKGGASRTITVTRNTGFIP